MIVRSMYFAAAIGFFLLPGSSAYAQAVPQPALKEPATSTREAATEVQPPPAAAPEKPANGPAPLVVYFASGSSYIRPQDEGVLDHASRLFNEGKPIVMIITGATDTVGSPTQNLTLSERRAGSVLSGLVARGIPADRFQVLAKGETEPAVPTPDGVAEAQNRRVEISWR